jgi:hypothetical protein
MAIARREMNAYTHIQGINGSSVPIINGGSVSWVGLLYTLTLNMSAYGNNRALMS